jgi:hypothetical protein
MLKWALFKLNPIDGDYDVQTPQGGLEVYAFDWKKGMQYWWTCEYDAFPDQDRQEGKQIVVMDDQGCEEALSVYVNWGLPEISRYIRKVFAVHDYKSIMVNKVGEGLYTWRRSRKPDAPEMLDFAIKLGTTTFMTELEDGRANELGEWLSRGVGPIIPPFHDCHIDRQKITHPKEPIELWAGCPGVKPTVREKEHIQVFQIAKKKFTSKQIRCSFSYDLEEIVMQGNSLSEHIPAQPALAEFPAQPWPVIVHIQIKRFKSVWKLARKNHWRRYGEESSHEYLTCQTSWRSGNRSFHRTGPRPEARNRTHRGDLWTRIGRQSNFKPREPGGIRYGGRWER